MEYSTVFSQQDINENKAVAALANIPVLFWLPLVAAKGSPMGMFYCNQGFWLLIASVVASMLSYVPLIGWIAGFALWVAVVVFAILGIAAAWQGKAREVPVLGKTVVFK